MEEISSGKWKKDKGEESERGKEREKYIEGVINGGSRFRQMENEEKDENGREREKTVSKGETGSGMGGKYKRRKEEREREENRRLDEGGVINGGSKWKIKKRRRMREMEGEINARRDRKCEGEREKGVNNGGSRFRQMGAR